MTTFTAAQHPHRSADNPTQKADSEQAGWAT
jgi:hypothetical protein